MKSRMSLGKKGMSPGKIVFVVVPSKTIIGVPGKVVYLHYSTVYCVCLSVVLVAFILVET